MISLGWGSRKARLISAWPLLRDLRWKLASLPCLQKLATWEKRCWAKQWAVGVHCAGAILRIGAATAGAVALAPVPGAGPSRKQQEGARGLPYAPPASLSACLCNLLKKTYHQKLPKNNLKNS